MLFHGKRHPREMGAAEIESFLTHLAVEGNVAASTQNQAFSAILFLYQQVLKIELPQLNALRAKRPERLPMVLSVGEVRAILTELVGIDRLQTELLYGWGCGSWNAVGCASRISISRGGRSSYAKGKGTKTGWCRCRCGRRRRC